MKRLIIAVCVPLIFLFVFSACQNTDSNEAAQEGSWLEWAGWAEWLECPDIAAQTQTPRSLLHIFARNARVYSTRRGLVMEHFITSYGTPAVAPMPFICCDGTRRYAYSALYNYCAAPRWVDYNHFQQNIYICSRHFDNVELKNALLDFTGMCPDFVNFRPGGRVFWGGMPPLTERQWEEYELLKDFRVIANAAFLQDRNNDPVITSILLPHFWMNPHDYFIIMLYSDVIPGGLEAEIMDFTGMDAGGFRLRAWEANR